MYDKTWYHDPLDNLTDIDIETAFNIVEIHFHDIDISDEIYFIEYEDEGDTSTNYHIVRKLVDLKRGDISEKFEKWATVNQISYNMTYDDYYEYDAYEYPVGFAGLCHYHEFHFDISKTDLIALKMELL